PWAVQTTPALVSALDGGDVYTTNDEAHVYIPPRGLARDAVLRIDPLDPSAVPATLPDGATRVAPGFAIGMEGVPLEKTAALDLAVSGDVAPPGTQLAIYVAGGGGVWQRLGGTLDAAGARLATPFSAAGNYAIFAAPTGASLAGSLALSLTPRILSSRGPIASPDVRIGFVLARAGAVRVTIHNRAGRLVRVVMSGETLGPGTNLVSWDGRDEDHHEVDSGLYLVTVEALGETRTQTLGVVR
ncbi:MAG: FlgD immunoglobulin-like domain containing protein, partial [Candidatus Eisenbacteria bacterium]